LIDQNIDAELVHIYT